MTQKRVGRPRVCPMVSNWIKTLRAEGHSYDDIAKITGMSKATCWRYAKDIEIKRETYFLSLISATFPISGKVRPATPQAKPIIMPDAALWLPGHRSWATTTSMGVAHPNASPDARSNAIAVG